MNYRTFTKLSIWGVLSFTAGLSYANDTKTFILENTISFTLSDWDGDGIPDYKDLDSDNDGISDLIEGGTNPLLDKNNDGYCTYIEYQIGFKRLHNEK